jgi:hypothetical protein
MSHLFLKQFRTLEWDNIEERETGNCFLFEKIEGSKKRIACGERERLQYFLAVKVNCEETI